jgi:hypothetical protein
MRMWVRYFTQYSVTYNPTEVENPLRHLHFLGMMRIDVATIFKFLIVKEETKLWKKN